MNSIESRGTVRGVMRVGIFCMALVMIAMTGCAGKAPVALPEPYLEANRQNQRGIKAEAKGDYRRALEAFSESLRINSSLENSEGIVIALVNSARVQRRNGDAAAALALVSRAVPLAEHQARLYPEVAFEMAQIKLLSGELGESSQWAAKAAAGNGPGRGMRVNLLARVLYLQGNLAGAEAKAREALLLSREEPSRGEEANALRLLGDILAVHKRFPEAAQSYDQALAIDKNLGLSRKIAADLRGRASVALLQEEFDLALEFYRRAFGVSSAGGEYAGAADDLLQLSRIHEKRGEHEQSGRLLAERDALLKKLATP